MNTKKTRSGNEDPVIARRALSPTKQSHRDAGDCFVAKTAPRNDKKAVDLRLSAARLLIAVVVAWNLQCALAFFLHPAAFAPGFELTGIPGGAAVRGFAVLFVMWNIPYLLALWHPLRHRLSLFEALAMQFVGVIGESLILFSIPTGHAALHASLLRFILFDGAGVVLLIGALLVHKRA
jgi:hypothetical protein